MFGFLKRDKKDPRWGEYEGEGIWYACPGCDALHPIEDPEFDALMEQLCAEYTERCQTLYDAFDFNTGGRWDVVEEESLFILTTGEGRKVHAQYGIAASWNAKTHSWMWAWGFPHEWQLPDGILEPARRVQAEGEAQGWKAATSRLLAVNEHEAWHLTNLTAHVMGWPLTYRAKVNDINTHYFVLSEPRWAN